MTWVPSTARSTGVVGDRRSARLRGGSGGAGRTVTPAATAPRTQATRRTKCSGRFITLVGETPSGTRSGIRPCVQRSMPVPDSSTYVLRPWRPIFDGPAPERCARAHSPCAQPHRAASRESGTDRCSVSPQSVRTRAISTRPAGPGRCFSDRHCFPRRVFGCARRREGDSNRPCGLPQTLQWDIQRPPPVHGNTPTSEGLPDVP